MYCAVNTSINTMLDRSAKVSVTSWEVGDKRSRNASFLFHFTTVATAGSYKSHNATRLEMHVFSVPRPADIWFQLSWQPRQRQLGRCDTVIVRDRTRLLQEGGPLWCVRSAFEVPSVIQHPRTCSFFAGECQVIVAGHVVPLSSFVPDHHHAVLA